MSFAGIKEYFRTTLSTVDSDLREWTDGFNIENIPETIINKSWHLKFEATSPRTIDQKVIEFDYPVTLNVFVLSGRDVSAGVDTALTLAESIYKECIQHSNRLGQSADSATCSRILNVTPGSMSINPIDDSNDNTLRIEMSFTCHILIQLNTT